jgi:chemotaxis signal transduction protein
VDAIGDIVTLPHDRIEPRSDSSEAKADVCSLTDDLVVGVGKTESELIIILDARRLLTGVVRTLARSGGGGTA